MQQPKSLQFFSVFALGEQSLVVSPLFRLWPQNALHRFFCPSIETDQPALLALAPLIHPGRRPSGQPDVRESRALLAGLVGGAHSGSHRQDRAAAAAAAAATAAAAAPAAAAPAAAAPAAGAATARPQLLLVRRCPAGYTLSDGDCCLCVSSAVVYARPSVRSLAILWSRAGDANVLVLGRLGREFRGEFLPNVVQRQVQMRSRARRKRRELSWARRAPTRAAGGNVLAPHSPARARTARGPPSCAACSRPSSESAA
jgi:pyruvate/2-oxoglutarate dehydrogenase complex dihydrolipoamide acyltransferase (E2) component